MDTLNGMAQTAAKAVWPEDTNKIEPASGVQGDVSKGEPFDGGNLDSNKRDSKFDDETDIQIQDDVKPSKTEVESVTPSKKDTTSRSKDIPASTASREDDITTVSKGDTAPTKTAANEDISTTTSSSKEGDLGFKDDTITSSKEAQADDAEANPAEEPEEFEGKESVMGDGPRPVDTVARENGGDAGNVGHHSDSTSDDKGDTDGQGNEASESKGTGEEYVKSSGLAADGGDFDATNPGAGREADRLMNEMGMERQNGGDKPKHDSAETSDTKGHSSSKDEKEKPSLKDRVKDKLHMNKSG